MDVSAFFPSLSELKVYRVFRALGYGGLISFELARLATYAPPKSFRYAHPQWINRHDCTIVAYANLHQGFLPQGAPTSPMLSNLIMRGMDERITKIALHAGLTYTRYADDLTFSLREGEFSRQTALQLVGEVQDGLKHMGLYLNRKKTTISPPGSRKVVLGLLVDGSAPRLSREFRSSLRQHLHYAKNPTEHARARGFESVGGLRRHLKGLIDFAKMVDEPYGIAVLQQFDSIHWP
jgi:RNA-directed DNA polymerase